MSTVIKLGKGLEQLRAVGFSYSDSSVAYCNFQKVLTVDRQTFYSDFNCATLCKFVGIGK